MQNIWRDGIMGVVIGDALGVPVEFWNRNELKKQPVKTMEDCRDFYLPRGTWSDDSSMTLATLHSIYEQTGIDYDDIMNRFAAWESMSEYTPAGKAIGVGCTCEEAIYRYLETKDYHSCGRTGERANGNGALMRIMPACLYAYIEQKSGIITLDKALNYIHEVTALTHNHMRAKMACGIYFFMIREILDGTGNLLDKLQAGIDEAYFYYHAQPIGQEEWKYFGRMADLYGFYHVREEEILSKPYVVHSLEAAIWSLITSGSFEEGVLKAVNLGGDTDTIAAIAGGLAALHYGYDSIPLEWRNAVIKGEEILMFCKSVKGKMDSLM